MLFFRDVLLRAISPVSLRLTKRIATNLSTALEAQLAVRIIHQLEPLSVVELCFLGHDNDDNRTTPRCSGSSRPL